MSHPPTDNLAEWFLPQTLDERQLVQFHDQGFLVVGPILTEAGLQLMREECMAAWNEVKGPFSPDGTWLENALLINIHHHSELVRRYYFSGPLADIAEQLVSPNVKAATSQLTFKLRGNTQAFGWHHDNAYGELDSNTAISCLTALDDTDEENGCLRVIPGSHKAGQTDYRHSVEDKADHVPIEMQADESKAIPAPLKAGHSLIFHCHLLHKSEGNASKDRDRRVLFLRYADADAVEVYNERKPRLGRLVRGETKFEEVRNFEANLPLI